MIAISSILLEFYLSHHESEKPCNLDNGKPRIRNLVVLFIRKMDDKSLQFCFLGNSGSYVASSEKA